MELVIHARDAELPATLTLPEGPIRGGLIPLHGSHCGERDHQLYRHLAEVFPPQGIAVLRYDRRPNGGRDVPFHIQAEDAREAVSLLRRHIGEAPVGLWGFSQGGGWVAPLAAATWPDQFSFVVNVSGSSVSPGRQMRYGLAEQLRGNGFGDRLGELAAFQDALYDCLRGRTDPAEMQKVIEVAEQKPWWSLCGFPDPVPEGPPTEQWVDLDYDPVPSYERLAAPVLSFYGETDEWTPIDDSLRAWREAARRGGHPAPTVVRLADCDHGPWLRTGEAAGEISPAYERALLDWVVERVGPVVG